MTPSDAAAPLRLGLIGRAHGLGGAFRVVGAADWYTFAPGATLLLDGEPRALLSVAGTQQSPILELAGIDLARAGRGACSAIALELRASDAPAPEDDAFWVRDLVGMRARCGERELGEVTDVLERPANDVLVLRLSDGREHLVPFTREAVPGVDVPGARAGAGGGVRPAARRVGGRVLEIDVFTLFPHWFAWLSEEPAVQRALNGPLSLRFLSYRDYSPLPHAQVDDAPFGGGAGMLHARRRRRERRGGRLRRRPRGGARRAPHRGARSGRAALRRRLRARARRRATAITLLCGRYEGFDARVLEHVATESLSLGPFVLSGGEPVAMAVVDALARLLPGSLADDQLERGGIVRAGAGRGARVPALHAARGVARASACPRSCSRATTRASTPGAASRPSARRADGRGR